MEASDARTSVLTRRLGQLGTTNDAFTRTVRNHNHHIRMAGKMHWTPLRRGIEYAATPSLMRHPVTGKPRTRTAARATPATNNVTCKRRVLSIMPMAQRLVLRESRRHLEHLAHAHDGGDLVDEERHVAVFRCSPSDVQPMRRAYEVSLSGRNKSQGGATAGLANAVGRTTTAAGASTSTSPFDKPPARVQRQAIVHTGTREEFHERAMMRSAMEGMCQLNYASERCWGLTRARIQMSVEWLSIFYIVACCCCESVSRERWRARSP